MLCSDAFQGCKSLPKFVASACTNAIDPFFAYHAGWVTMSSNGCSCNIQQTPCDFWGKGVFQEIFIQIADSRPHLRIFIMQSEGIAKQSLPARKFEPLIDVSGISREQSWAHKGRSVNAPQTYPFFLSWFRLRASNCLVQVVRVHGEDTFVHTFLIDPLLQHLRLLARELRSDGVS